ncbi:hypothetical protein ACJQWK_07493 [Exserohilum turcicum]|uniref:Uncharacterized protein n=1 Tax=Exserohilum turcicum (strain 28A) TaxID=671987 RepID=R0IZX2_EXST2|nr:uncharacterized protein SETTUDRAFT_167192 [Exserohilum turcica Et28A]EOA90295.1 hypothetical protein SETTUDRAFT_167192 [Exserohilum turcica Et28A]
MRSESVLRSFLAESLDVCLDKPLSGALEDALGDSFDDVEFVEACVFVRSIFSLFLSLSNW